jgi:hypothetical protein
MGLFDTETRFYPGSSTPPDQCNNSNSGYWTKSEHVANPSERTEKQKKIYPRRIIPRYGYGPLDGSLTCIISYCELDNPILSRPAFLRKILYVQAWPIIVQCIV